MDLRMIESLLRSLPPGELRRFNDLIAAKCLRYGGCSIAESGDVLLEDSRRFLIQDAPLTDQALLRMKE